MKNVAHHVVRVGLWMGLAAGLSLASVTATAAEPERSFAVISLIGDRLEIVIAQQGTGSNLDRNQRETIEDRKGGMDVVAQRLTTAAIDRIAPGSRVVGIGVPPSPMHDRQERFFEADHIVLPGVLVDALVNAKVSHLLLLTKRKDEARAPLADSVIGTGRVQGLGFYVDTEQRIIRGDDNSQVQGFIAPYVYVRLSLINVATGKVLGQQSVGRMRPVPVSLDPKAAVPWDVLTPAQKISALESLLREELNEKVAALLQR